MTFTSGRPIQVDGVRLDTLAWNITAITRATASRRSADLTVPGRDGAIASLNDDLDPVPFGLEMWLRGTDVDGVVPGAGSQDTLRDNLDNMLHLFGRRNGLLDVQETVKAGVVRRAWCKVTDQIAPDINIPGTSGVFTVALQIMSGTWEDVATTDSASMTGWVAAPTQEVTGLQGATEKDAGPIVVVTGPVTNPRLTDSQTGAYVQLNMALAAGDTWRINVGTWSTRTALSGSALTLASADTTGTDRQALTTFGGTRNQARFLPLTPIRDAGGVRRVKVTLSGTTGITAATAVQFRTCRRYAA